MNFNELFQKMRELDQPVQESDKASKDYDGDGEVERFFRQQPRRGS